MAQVYRCSWNSDTDTGVRIVNVFHVVSRPQGIENNAESAAAVRDALIAALKTKYKATLQTDCILQSLVVREELAPDDTSVPDEASATIAEAGTQVPSGDRLPWGCCLLATLYTNAAVRSGHGRQFLSPGISASALTASKTWDTASTAWTNAGTYLAELIAGHSTGTEPTGHDLSCVIYSRTRRARGDAQYYFDVVSYTRRQQPHWLRSRMSAP